MKILLACMGLTAGLLGMSHPVFAAENQTSAQMRANVMEVCRITSTPDLVFAQYDATDTHRTRHLETSVRFSLRCNAGSLSGRSIKILIDGGQNSWGNDCRNRQMSNGDGGLLKYELRFTTTQTAVWGCLSSHTIWSGTGFDSGRSNSLPVYARIPAGQSVPDGTNADTITVSLSF